MIPVSRTSMSIEGIILTSPQQPMTATVNSTPKKKTIPIPQYESAYGKVEIRPSNIPCAGFGAFAVVSLPEGFKLGEYRGRVLTQKQYENLPDREHRDAYVFEKAIRTGTKTKWFYVDAYFKKDSSWCRYVNGAKSAEQKKTVNVECYQYAGKLLYRTTKEVLPGEELIIDYGDEYWTDSEDESVSDEEMSE